MRLLHLSEIIVYVQDMATQVSFYRDLLGLPVLYPIQADYRDEMWVVFDTGACKLCLHGGAVLSAAHPAAEADEDDEDPGTPAEYDDRYGEETPSPTGARYAPKFVFAVENILAAHEYLSRIGVRVNEVRQVAPGVFVIDAWDPEGNAFCVESSNG